jgi:hypothetical protein
MLIFFFISGILCQTPQQSFRLRPQDKEVAQGGSVVIPCEVSNRQGRVQWTKDGLTLGKNTLIDEQILIICYSLII